MQVDSGVSFSSFFCIGRINNLPMTVHGYKGTTKAKAVHLTRYTLPYTGHMGAPYDARRSSCARQVARPHTSLLYGVRWGPIRGGEIYTKMVPRAGWSPLEGRGSPEDI